MEKELLDYGTLLEKLNNQSLDSDDELTLTCGICLQYLSVPPIFIGLENGNTCGRNYCRNNTEPGSTRNWPFENLARDKSFPCMFVENGCQEKLPWNTVEEHENTCEFSKFLCPFSYDFFKEYIYCNWKGKTSELTDHFEELHPERKLENYEYIDLSDVKENQIFFSKVWGSTVVIFVIFDTRSDLYCKVWVDLELFGKVSFLIDIQTGEDLYFTDRLSALILIPPFDHSVFDDSWLHVENERLKTIIASSITLNLEIDLIDSVIF